MKALRYGVVLAPLLGVGELAAHLALSEAAPDLESWRRIEPLVRELRQPDDAVIVSPRWAEPNARWALGDELMPVRDVARPDETAYARAVEVRILGMTSQALESWPVVEERSEGPFVVSVRENPTPARVRFDFVDHLEPRRVSVFVDRDGSQTPCPYRANAPSVAGGLGGHPTFPRRRFTCPEGQHVFAGVTVTEDERWLPRRCIWAHPVADAAFVIHFDDVPLGSVIRGHGALPWDNERRKSGAPVELEVRVDGRSIGKYTHVAGSGWELFSFPTNAEGRRGTVEFRSLSPDPSKREFCFHADTR